MKTYNIYYHDQWLATILIDKSKSEDSIKEMVQFWGNWEQRLLNNNGNYIKTWINQLISHIIYSGKPPDKDDEGWVPLDGLYGITLVNWSRYEFDEDLVEIEEGE